MEEMKKQLSAPRSEPVSEEFSLKCDLFPLPQDDLSVTRIRQSSPVPVRPESKPPRALKISDLNQARALRKSESQKTVNRSQSTDGCLTGLQSVSTSKGDESTVLKTVEITAEETVKPGVKVSSVVVLNKNVSAMRKVHGIRPIKQYEYLQRVRSSSNAKQRPAVMRQGAKTASASKEDSSGSASKASITELLASLHQKILTGDETDSLIRKTLRQQDTPTVAICLRKPFK
jgi:hypothetical protein